MPTDHTTGEQPGVEVNAGPPQNEKRPYSKPQLKRMGELRTLTQYSF